MNKESSRACSEERQVIKDMINDLLSLEIEKFKNDLASLLLTVSSYYDAASGRGDVDDNFVLR